MEFLTEMRVEHGVAALLARFRVPEQGDDAAAVQELAERAREVVNPKGVHETSCVETQGNDTVPIGEVAFSSRVLRVNLEDAHRISPFVVTCGPELDEIEGVRGPRCATSGSRR
jgi:hypothetical protein